MVPLTINPIYTLYSGYILDIFPFKGLLGYQHFPYDSPYKELPGNWVFGPSLLPRITLQGGSERIRKNGIQRSFSPPTAHNFHQLIIPSKQNIMNKRSLPFYLPRNYHGNYINFMEKNKRMQNNLSLESFNN